MGASDSPTDTLIAWAFRSNPVSPMRRQRRTLGTSWKCLRIFLRYNALCASYCKLWLNPGHGHGSPAERKMAMVIGRPLLKLNASTRGPRS
jgi:hypothetical protein